MKTEEVVTAIDNTDLQVTVIAALYWASFVKAAERPVEPGCIEVAIDMGLLDNIELVVDELAKYGEVYEQGKGCTEKAAEYATQLAGTGPITPAIFRAAVERLSGNMLKLVTRSEGVRFGPLC
jgi:hypothetical protein